MGSRVSELLEEIREREEELEDLIRVQEARLIYTLEGKKVHFEEAVRQAQQKLKVGTMRWLRESRPRNVLSSPIIYSMIVPFAFLDLCVSVYQWICFPLYRIAPVKRRKYIVMDRHQLSYLNNIEKLNCAYCGYVNGLVSYVREIVARTEQYWCPIKHARKVLDSHRHYRQFAAFGDADAYLELAEKQRSGQPPSTPGNQINSLHGD
jgi:hypothetical protein